jgi:ABC-type dipeptide/oligopeptide/nickel transport system permease subunit
VTVGIPATEAVVDEPPGDSDTDAASFHGRSPTRIALGRLRQDKLAMSCALVVLILVLLAIFADVINEALKISAYQNGPYALDNVEALDPFNLPIVGPPGGAFTWDHPLGIAPNTAEDNLARLLLGLRTSLIIATVATVATTVIGLALGLIAGFSRGWLDRAISFVIDLLLSFPFILGALTLAPIIVSRADGDNERLQTYQFYALIGVLVVFGWMGLARLIRGQVLSLREREFIQAAQVIGAPTRRILFKELLPNLVAPIVIAISLGLPAFIAAEAGLAFIGLGLTGEPSLGQIVERARGFYELYPSYLFVPVGVIATLVLALNLLGDSVRDAFDPKTRR